MAVRRRPARVLGVAAIVLGVVGGIALWLLADKRYDDAVADLAPAPIGCDTTLVFDRVGTYTFFVETKGRVGEIDGDCDTDDRAYDLGDAEPPEVGLTLVDADGREVELERTDGPTYDRSGARGTGVGAVRIEETGDYVLTADADASEAMIRVGRDPAQRRHGDAGGCRRRPHRWRRPRRAAPGVGAAPTAAHCTDGRRTFAGVATDRPSSAAHGTAVRQPTGTTAVRRAATTPERAAASARLRPTVAAADAAAPALSGAQRRRMTVTTRP